MRNDDVLAAGALGQRLPPSEGEVRTARQTEEVARPCLAVHDIDPDLVHDVERLQTRVRARIADLFRELVGAIVHREELLLEVRVEAQPSGQSLLEGLGPILVYAHPHRDRLVLRQGVEASLLPLRLHKKHVVHVEDLRVQPHLDDLDGASQHAAHNVQGREASLVDLVVELREGLRGEVRSVHAVLVQQRHELILLVVPHERPSPILLGLVRADGEVDSARKADFVQLFLILILDVDHDVVSAVSGHDPGNSCR
mmetsp:Transcript_82306/g.266472  ORF Transcript_82306/g.266472 Transcript_82306/m.266472 type:complete len:255 (+) Transcript_82306:2179-2943(+)